MKIFGIVGKKLGHSFSPGHFSKKFRDLKIDAEYRLFEMDDIEELPDLINENEGLKGLNITIPYKRSVYQFMDEVDKIAKLTGSINTIKVKRKKGVPYLTGYNTDVYGFEQTVKGLLKNKVDTRALILGTGGSAHSVAYVLRKLGIFYSFVSRNPSKVEHICYEWFNEQLLNDHKVIINTTPLGMYPDVDSFPDIPYEFLGKDHLLYDLVYNPEETQFLKKGRAQGADTINGLDLLGIQADLAWKLWNK